MQATPNIMNSDASKSPVACASAPIDMGPSTPPTSPTEKYSPLAAPTRLVLPSPLSISSRMEIEVIAPRHMPCRISPTASIGPEADQTRTVAPAAQTNRPSRIAKRLSGVAIRGNDRDATIPNSVGTAAQYPASDGVIP